MRLLLGIAIGIAITAVATAYGHGTSHTTITLGPHCTKYPNPALHEVPQPGLDRLLLPGT